MSKTQTKKTRSTPTNGASGGGRKRYERTTPVGRVLKHLQKARKISAFAIERLETWSSSTDEALVNALVEGREALTHLEASVDFVARLFHAEWTPPKKSTAVVYTEGEKVRISEKYKEKYLHIYKSDVVDDLVVAKLLPTGEIAVRHGTQAPFIVAKSHIERQRVRSSAE